MQWLFQHSWAAIVNGVAFLNVDYLRPDSDFPVQAQCRREQVSYLVSGYLFSHMGAGDRATLVCVGRLAQDAGSQIAGRLRDRKVRCVVHNARQPVTAYRKGIRLRYSQQEVQYIHGQRHGQEVHLSRTRMAAISYAAMAPCPTWYLVSASSFQDRWKCLEAGTSPCRMLLANSGACILS